MNRMRCSKIPERDIDILVEYNSVLKKYGDLSRVIRKQTLYEEVADKFYLTWPVTARIIRRMIKSNINIAHQY